MPANTKIREGRFRRTLTGRLVLQVLVEQEDVSWNPHTMDNLGYTTRVFWRNARRTELRALDRVDRLPVVETPARRPLLRTAAALGGCLGGLLLVGAAGAGGAALIQGTPEIGRAHV